MDSTLQITLKKKAYHHGDLRNAIILQAVARARTDGEKAIVLREIAAEIGVSATAAYRHFTNRAQLVAHVAVQGFEEVDRRLDVPVVTDGGGVPSGERAGLAAYLDLHNACVALLDFSAQEGPWARLMLESLGGFELVQAAARATLLALDARLERGVPSGLVDGGHDLVNDTLFWAGIDGLATLLMHGLAPGESAAEALGDTAARMLGMCTSHLLTDAGRRAVAEAGLPPTRVLADLAEWVPA